MTKGAAGRSNPPRKRLAEEPTEDEEHSRTKAAKGSGENRQDDIVASGAHTSRVLKTTSGACGDESSERSIDRKISHDAVRLVDAKR